MWPHLSLLGLLMTAKLQAGPGGGWGDKQDPETAQKKTLNKAQFCILCSMFQLPGWAGQGDSGFKFYLLHFPYSALG